jgi:hypothetical protein
MSGGHQALLMSGGAASGVINAAFEADLESISTVAGLRQVSLNWWNDGSATWGGAAGATGFWIAPAAPDSGTFWSVRVTVNSAASTTFTGFAPNVWTPIGAKATFTVGNSGTSNMAVGGANIHFSRDGGATAIPGGIFGWQVGREIIQEEPTN